MFCIKYAFVKNKNCLKYMKEIGWVEQLGKFVTKIVGTFRKIKSQVLHDKNVMKTKFVAEWRKGG